MGIGSISVTKGSISRNITATEGGIGSITVGGSIEGDIVATGGDIGDITTGLVDGGGITGDITANATLALPENLGGAIGTIRTNGVNDVNVYSRPPTHACGTTYGPQNTDIGHLIGDITASSVASIQVVGDLIGAVDVENFGGYSAGNAAYDWIDIWVQGAFIGSVKGTSVSLVIWTDLQYDITIGDVTSGDDSPINLTLDVDGVTLHAAAPEIQSTNGKVFSSAVPNAGQVVADAFNSIIGDVVGHVCSRRGEGGWMLEYADGFRNVGGTTNRSDDAWQSDSASREAWELLKSVLDHDTGVSITLGKVGYTWERVVHPADGGQEVPKEQKRYTWQKNRQTLSNSGYGVADSLTIAGHNDETSGWGGAPTAYVDYNGIHDDHDNHFFNYDKFTYSNFALVLWHEAIGHGYAIQNFEWTVHGEPPSGVMSGVFVREDVGRRAWNVNNPLEYQFQMRSPYNPF